MLPAAKIHKRSLAEVLPNCVSALDGAQGSLRLSRVDKAIVVVADGLGHAQLAAHTGHARTLAARLGSDGPIGSGFPTTTVAALTSLTTGAASGQHGLVGYNAYVPGEDRVINQLSGWQGLDPAAWQRMPTVLEQAGERGIRSVAISLPRFRDSPFTGAMLRGAEFLPAADADARLAHARTVLTAPGPALVYYYVSDLDVAGHAVGVDSARWRAALESFDAEIARLAALLSPSDGMLVTADHGMVDVPAHRQRVVDASLLDGVRHVAGEPRCVQLHLEAGIAADDVAARWRDAEGERAWIATRDEAIASGWFGSVDDAVRPRIGQVLVAARRDFAFYTDADDRARGMVGQHGSLTAAELTVPLLRFGAFAAA